MRLIDVDARIEEIKKANCTGCNNYNGIRCRACWVDDTIGLFDDAPTVDAVEVVRCTDCKWYDKAFCYHHGQKYLGVDRNHFCSYGERRTDV